MMRFRSAHAPNPAPARWTAIVFALAVLVAGLLPGGLVFTLNPNAASTIGLTGVPVPGWVFTLVWLIIYPSMGIATWLIWQQRAEVDVSVPLAIFLAAFLQTLSFWFTNSLHMTAVIDATGVMLAYTVAWVYSRYAKATTWWLLPWLAWMPITLGIKLWGLYSGAP